MIKLKHQIEPDDYLVVESGSLRILVLRSAREFPDIVNDLEGMINKLDIRDTNDLSHALIIGSEEVVGVPLDDIQSLVNRKIPYLKEATAHFIIRNMGGEAIKVDRWIQEFLDYYSLSKDKLEQLLSRSGIRLGLFDAVLWSYCEMFVADVKALPQHFNSHNF